MNKEKIIEKIISKERFNPYLKYHNNDINKALEHYKINILVSESFYPLLSILEIGLRNSIDSQMTLKFNDKQWFENSDFFKIASKFQTDRIFEARTNILISGKDISHGKIISELSFGFWTSLFDLKFEMTLWKNLRLSFVNCPKQIRKRKTISSKLNKIRNFRNRIFHHEPVTWNINVINLYKNELLEAIYWIDNDVVEWMGELNKMDLILEKNKYILKNHLD